MRHTDVHLVERNGTIQNWFEMYRQTDQTRMCLNQGSPCGSISRTGCQNRRDKFQDKERRHSNCPALMSPPIEYSGGRSGRSCSRYFSLRCVCYHRLRKRRLSLGVIRQHNGCAGLHWHRCRHHGIRRSDHNRRRRAHSLTLNLSQSLNRPARVPT